MEFLGNIYETIRTILTESMAPIQDGMFDIASEVFNNGWFQTSFTIILLYLGWQLFSGKMKADEIGQRFVWTLLIYGLVQFIITDKKTYEQVNSAVNLPRNVLSESISKYVTKNNKEATIQNGVTNSAIAIGTAVTKVWDDAGWKNIAGFFVAFIILIVGLAFLITVIFMSLISVFLAQFVLCFLPFALMMWTFQKTTGIFFGWLKLYISLSLYEPIVSMFAIVLAKMSEYTSSICSDESFGTSMSNILGLLILYMVATLCLFKIPNLINQVIGSTNEGGRLSNAVKTAGAGGSIGKGIFKGIKGVGGLIGRGLGGMQSSIQGWKNKRAYM
jgi:type IV secretion system protein VirB6